jgi:hypothetical protein
VADESQFSMSGQLKANGKVRYAGAEVSFDVGDGRLTFHADMHDVLQHNLRAIGLTLEALRAVDRYGVAQSGQQYAGFAMIGPGGPSAERGAALVREAGSVAAALKRHHPDHGGSAQAFADVQAYRTRSGAG